ncbi:MAG: hypothetical protein R3C14_36035 [Caldilineaceae bacterium]
MIVEYTWTSVACVYLLDNGMTIGDLSRLSVSPDLMLPAAWGRSDPKHIEAMCVRITFPTINTLRITWHDGTPIRQGSILYSGAFLIVE